MYIIIHVHYTQMLMWSFILSLYIIIHLWSDNELPDYIMVMLVNKKTFHQISNDLQLFLGHHTSTFIDWLQEAVTTGITGMENKNTSAAGTG